MTVFLIYLQMCTVSLGLHLFLCYAKVFTFYNFFRSFPILILFTKHYLPVQKASPGTVSPSLWNTSEGCYMGREIFTAENKLRYHNSSGHRIAWIHVTSFGKCKWNLLCAMYIKPFKLHTCLPSLFYKNVSVVLVYNVCVI